jgi:putative ABC transport system permease protein
VTLIVITQAAAYGGAAIVGPAFVRASGRILQCVLAWVASLPFRLALENLPRSPQRAGATVATIAAAVGMAVTLAGLVGSFQAAWTSWLEHQFSADLFVGSGGRFRLGAGPAMDASLRADIAEVEGVATVEPFRVLPIRLGERPVFLQGISVRERLQHGGLQMVEGSLSAAASRLRAGEAVLVSDNLASRLGLHAGDAVDVPTPFGPRSFAIAGTFVDFVGSLDLGSIAVDHDQLRLVWGDRSANLFRVWIRPGASLLDVRRGILARIGEGGYYVATSSDFLRQVRSVLDRFFIATWGLQVIAALVAVIGVVNAQLATVLDRSIEIGMMRTIGVRRSDVTRAVVLECAMLGALGSVAGLVLGAMLGAQFVGISLRFVTGWRIPFFAPWTAGSAAILTAAVVSAVAGYVPAARVAMLPSPRSRD